MKFIISESKIDSLSLENKSDIFYKLINVMFPNLYEDESEDGELLNFYSEEDGDLLFYYDYQRKEFYVGGNFLEKVYELTGLPFLNVEENISKNRKMFDELMKVFFKRHYGYSPEKVYFHFH
jgi:hypothetical protein